jgi:exosome complex RNA-binding protein Rrp42 (RNase PH superfamily)
VRHNTRPDGRPLHKVRPTTIITNVISRNSYGSSLVHIGSTKVLTAITLLVGHPSALHPNQGEVDVHVHFSPLCSNRYNLAGRVVHSEEVGLGSTSSKIPDIHSSKNPKVSTPIITLAALSLADPLATESYIRRTIQSSHIIKLEDLCLEQGKSAWKVQLTCVVLNQDGNVVDAAILGCVSALADLHLPQTRIIKDTITGQSVVRIVESNKGTTSQGRHGTCLRLQSIPVPLSFLILEGQLLVDPTLAEEAVCDGSITIVVDAAKIQGTAVNGGCLNGPILSLQKLGGSTNLDSLEVGTQLAFGRAQELKALLQSLSSLNHGSL